MNPRIAYPLLALVAVALVAGTVVTLRSDAPPDVVDQPVEGRLGPTHGPDSLGHIEGKHAYLDRLADTDPDAPAAALVSMRRMLTGAEAQSAAIGLEVSAAFVKFGDADAGVIAVETSIPVAVAARATELREVVSQEIEALERELEGAEGEAADRLEELLAESRSSLEAITPECSCVYAFATEHATVRRLVEVRSQPDVRLVDVPEPLTDGLGGWELTPILPPGEESG